MDCEGSGSGVVTYLMVDANPPIQGLEYFPRCLFSILVDHILVTIYSGTHTFHRYNDNSRFVATRCSKYTFPSRQTLPSPPHTSNPKSKPKPHPRENPLTETHRNDCYDAPRLIQHYVYTQNSLLSRDAGRRPDPSSRSFQSGLGPFAKYRC